MQASGQAFDARLTEWKGKKLDKFDLNDEATAHAARADVEAGRFRVASVETKPQARNPQPPLTTSTLQQQAARQLHFTAIHTLRPVQHPYYISPLTLTPHIG